MVSYLWSLVTSWCGQQHPHVKAHVDCSYTNESSSSSEDLPQARKTWLEKHRPTASEKPPEATKEK